MLYIEGTRDENNGDLAEGFRVLFEKRLKGNMPRIVMSNGKNEAVDKFLNTNVKSKRFEGVQKYILIDLDKADKNNAKSEDRKEYKLDSYTDVSFYMVQEMEAWFISQAEHVLDKYYKVQVSSKIPKRDAKEFVEPDVELAKWLRSLKKDYKKVKDGVELLKLLNIEQLEKDFVDVKNLMTELAKA